MLVAPQLKTNGMTTLLSPALHVTLLSVTSSPYDYTTSSNRQGICRQTHPLALLCQCSASHFSARRVNICCVRPPVALCRASAQDWANLGVAAPGALLDTQDTRCWIRDCSLGERAAIPNYAYMRRGGR